MSDWPATRGRVAISPAAVAQIRQYMERLEVPYPGDWIAAVIWQTQVGLTAFRSRHNFNPPGIGIGYRDRRVVPPHLIDRYEDIDLFFDYSDTGDFSVFDGKTIDFVEGQFTINGAR